jgi:hypothetical protein
MQDQVTSSDSADRVAQLEAGRMAAPLAPGGPQPCWRRRELILKAGDRPAGRGRPRLRRPVGRARNPDAGCRRLVLTG